ncbi:proton-coupled zinc antiporter SLC30A2 [Patella vulgata]|uniref:proton-coupled zinc antiporter SLC30A2 n=1 Tax=Patella vulgata TaxID=6465 RepID=UPI0024A9C1DD|nr:proton-coupled zinc antiporter SLC30A2 [Patella vulgata]
MNCTTSIILLVFIGGFLSNSLALFTDVLHLGSDLISFTVSLVSVFLSQKTANKTMSFGYHRAEVVGVLFSVLIIWITSGILCFEAAERIIYDYYKDVKPDEMLITAGIGVLFNFIMAAVLNSNSSCCSSGSIPQFGHTHSGDSKHVSYGTTGDYEPLDEKPAKNKNINVKAALIHAIGDTVQSLCVLTAALIIKFTNAPEYRLADPICTFVFFVIVLVTTVTILRDVCRVLLESVPNDIKYTDVRTLLESIEGVKMIHSLHIWPLTMGRNAVMVHITKGDKVESEGIMEMATNRLKTDFNFSYITVQVEKYNSEVMPACKDCQDLC